VVLSRDAGTRRRPLPMPRHSEGRAEARPYIKRLRTRWRGLPVMHACFAQTSRFMVNKLAATCRGERQIPHRRSQNARPGSGRQHQSVRRSGHGMPCPYEETARAGRTPALEETRAETKNVARQARRYKSKIRRGGRCIRAFGASSRASRGRPWGPSRRGSGGCFCCRGPARGGRTGRCAPRGRSRC
jgi:hypothetical protein